METRNDNGVVGKVQHRAGTISQQELAEILRDIGHCRFHYRKEPPSGLLIFRSDTGSVSRIDRAARNHSRSGSMFGCCSKGILEQAPDRLLVGIGEVVAVLRLLVRDLDPGVLQALETRQASLNSGAVVPGDRIFASTTSLTR